MESELSPLGVRQAVALASFFTDQMQRGEPVPARVITSPMKRCTSTAAFTAEFLGLPVTTDARIIEIAHGDWDGRMRDEIASSDPQRYHTWRTEPARVSFTGGESLRDVDRRWRAFAAGLPHDGSDLLVCTHDAVLRVALLALQDRPLEEFWNVRAENGAFALIDNSGPTLRVIDECVTAHLGDDRAVTQRQAL